MSSIKKMLCSLLLAASSFANATPVLVTSDFIATPSYFNGFESIPNDGTFYTGASKPYTEGGITVRQIHGDAGNDIWVALGGMQGSRSWYPNGGDNGYTDITLASGADFADISFLFNAYGSGNLQYSLLNNGVEVLSGSLTAASGNVFRAGFTGGGFDELLVRTGSTGTFGDNRSQALQIDSIKANQVPEPGSIALLGLGLMGVLAARRKAVK